MTLIYKGDVWGFKVEHDEYDAWDVALPHSCDAWEIVDSDDYERAVETLESFIKEAQAALKALKENGSGEA